MQRILKFASYVVLALSVLLLLVFLTLKAITDKQYRSMITYGVQSVTSREFSIAGDFSLDLTSSLSLVASDISFSNAEWGSQPEMFSLQRIETELNLLALLRGVLELRILAETPNLLLEKDELGRANWVMGLPVEDEEEQEPNDEKGVGGFTLQPNIRNFVLNQGKFIYRDTVSEKKIDIRVDNITLDQNAETLQVDFKGAYNALPFSINGQLSDMVQLLDNGSTPLQFTSQTGETQLMVNGTVGFLGPDVELDVAVDLQSNSLADFSLFTDAAIPDLGPLTASLNLTRKKGLYSLKDLGVKLDSDKMKADVSGSIVDLVRLEGIELQTSVETNSLPEILAQTEIELGFSLPPSVKAKVSVQGSRDMLTVNDFLINCSDEGIQVQVNGTAKNIVKLDRIKAEAAISTESLRLLSSYAQTDLPDTGPLNVFAVLTSRDGIFRLAKSSINLNDKHLQAKIEGTIEDLLKLKGVNADIDIKLDTLSSLNTLLGQDLPDSGLLALQGTLVNKGGTGTPTTIAATLNGDELRVKVDGTVDEIINAKSVNARVVAELDSLSILSKFLKIELPDQGKLNVSANIASNVDTYALSKIKADLASEQFTVSVVGSVSDLLKFQDVNANIDLNLESLNELSKIVKIELPDLGPLKASAKITSLGNVFSAQKVIVEVADNQLQGNISGSIGDLLKFRDVSANIDLNLESLNELSKIVKIELPDLGPLKASAKISSMGDVFSAQNVLMDLANDQLQGNISGSVGNLLKMNGINADIKVAVDTLSSLDALVDQELPDSGPLLLQGNLGSKSGIEGPTTLSLDLAGEGVVVNIVGEVRDITGDREVAVTFDLDAESLVKVGRLGGIDLPSIEPLQMNGKLSVSGNSFMAENIYAKLGNSDVRGNAGFTPAEGAVNRPRVTGKLDFGELDLTQKNHVEDSQPEESVIDEMESIEGNISEVKREKLFSSKPFPLDVLKTLDAELNLSAKRLDTDFFLLEDVDSQLKLENGVLSILPSKATIGDGTFDAWLKLDNNWQPAKMSTLIKFNNTTFKNFGGKVNLDADLNGAGDSVASLMAGLSGQLIIQINDAELKQEFISDFGAGLMDSLNPFAKEEKTTLLECAIVRLVITDGLVDMNKKMAAQTTKVTWFGNGLINLKTEEFGIAINPVPRKGFGISSGVLANLVSVGGTLANPEVQLDPKDIGLQIGSYSIAVATGGLSLLAQRFMQHRKANSDVCAEILKETSEEEEKKRKKEAGKEGSH